MSTATDRHVDLAIVGAGPVGCLLALLLARRGERVEVFEARPDPRTAPVPGGRSINLTLAERGWRALRAAGIEDDLRALTMPLRGRMIHGEDGTLRLQPYTPFGDAIHSASRAELTARLVALADARPEVSFVDLTGELVSSRVVPDAPQSVAALSISYRILGPSASISAGAGGGDVNVTFTAPVSGFGVGDLRVVLPDGRSVRLDAIDGVSIVGDRPGTSFTVRGVTAGLRAAGYALTGTHTISIEDAGVAIETADGARLRGTPSFSWDVPSVSIEGAPATPAFAAAGVVRIVRPPRSQGSGWRICACCAATWPCRSRACRWTPSSPSPAPTTRSTGWVP